MNIEFNNPVRKEESPVEPVVTTEPVGSQSTEPVILETPVDYGISDYLPEVAQFLYDKGHIKHIPEDFDPESLNMDSYDELLKYNQEQVQKEFFTQGLKTYESQLQSKLPPLGKRILEYSLQNQNVSDDDIQQILQEVRTQEYYSQLDPENNPDRVVREYYSQLGWSDDLVNQKLARLVETGDLESEAKMAKPHLDKVAKRAAQVREEEDRAIREFQAQLDRQLETQTNQQLRTGKLNGVDLDRETASFLQNAVMNKNVPVQLGKQTVEMGYAEALMREQKYKGKIENVMLSLLVLRDGPKALDKFFAQPIKNKTLENHIREIKFSSKKRGSAQKPVHEDFSTGITFNRK